MSAVGKPDGGHVPRCQRVCTNTCSRARNKRCDDGGPNDPGPDYRPVCSLGTDCSDCGSRLLCAPHMTSLRLPRHAIEKGSSAPPLDLGEILFMVMGSGRYRQRTMRAYRTWCSQPRRLACIFFSDSDPGGGAGGLEGSGGYGDLASADGGEDVPLVQVSAGPPPVHCCPLGAKSTFCSWHRASTLPAQYRFLPALQHVKQSAAFTRGRFRWLVLVDDDSFVFATHLRWVLSRLDATQPLYLGDFGSSTEAFGLHVPRFACGGGGSILSAEAVRRMDLLGCIGRYHAQCMQSDWMIGGCARRHNASLIRELGCSTCDPKRIDRRAVAAKLTRDQCFFLQNGLDFAHDLPLGPHSPAIVHGIPNELFGAFVRRHLLHENGSAPEQRIGHSGGVGAGGGGGGGGAGAGGGGATQAGASDGGGAGGAAPVGTNGRIRSPGRLGGSASGGGGRGSGGGRARGLLRSKSSAAERRAAAAPTPCKRAGCARL